MTKLNAMIHSARKTSPLRIAETAMRRTRPLFDLGRAVGSAWRVHDRLSPVPLSRHVTLFRWDGLDR